MPNALFALTGRLFAVVSPPTRRREHRRTRTEPKRWRAAVQPLLQPEEVVIRDSLELTSKQRIEWSTGCSGQPQMPSLFLSR